MNDANLRGYAEPILKLLAFKKATLNDLPTLTSLTEEQLMDIVKYLKANGAVTYLKTLALGFNGVINFEVTDKGTDVAWGKRTLNEQPIFNSQNVVVNAPVQNLSQVQGNGNFTSQSIENFQYMNLKRMIETDDELDDTKKKSLLDLLKKFNLLKETGENVQELLSSVVSIAVKYGPLFLKLLK